MDNTQEARPLTTREKIVLQIFMMMIKIVKPTSYSHEYSDEIKIIKELIA